GGPRIIGAGPAPPLVAGKAGLLHGPEVGGASPARLEACLDSSRGPAAPTDRHLVGPGQPARGNRGPTTPTAAPRGAPGPATRLPFWRQAHPTDAWVRLCLVAPAGVDQEPVAAAAGDVPGEEQARADAQPEPRAGLLGTRLDRVDPKARSKVQVPEPERVLDV